MKYRTIALRRAEADLREISHWIAARSPDGAERWLQAYERVIQRVAQHPLGFSLAEEADEFPDCELRQFLFKTRRGLVYRGVFVVVGNEVRILRVRGPGQPPLTTDDASY